MYKLCTNDKQKSITSAFSLEILIESACKINVNKYCFWDFKLSIFAVAEMALFHLYKIIPQKFL